MQSFRGEPKPKIDHEELLELLTLWQFDPETYSRLEQLVRSAKPAGSPWLVRYMNPNTSKVDLLEERARKLFGASYALAVNSGTTALETAFAACGIGPGDEVIIPGYTFFATASAVVAAGAVPIIAEIDESLTLDPQDFEKKITRVTRAVAPVHMMGTSADMATISDIARGHNLSMIEDVAQACGASFEGRRLGTWGTVGAFSISSFKTVGAGEGGLVLTEDETIYKRALNYHDSGACWREDRYAPERFEGELFCGSNFRMSELEGAVNLVQISKMDRVITQFQEVKRRVVERISVPNDLVPQAVRDPNGEIGNFLAFFCPTYDEAGFIKDSLVAEGLESWRYGLGDQQRDWHIYAFWDQILNQRLATRNRCPFSCSQWPVAQPLYSKNMCPKTLNLLERVVFVNMYQWWTQDDCEDVAETINSVLSKRYGPSRRPWSIPD